MPFILHEIETQPRRQYLLLHSLKEVISAQSASHVGVQVNISLRSQRAIMHLGVNLVLSQRTTWIFVIICLFFSFQGYLLNSTILTLFQGYLLNITILTLFQGYLLNITI